MKAAYVDTSALVAVAFGERESSRLTRTLRTFDRLYSATLLEAEFLAAAEREGLRREAAPLLRPIRWVYPDARLTAELEAVLDVGYLRGADLHHLATALRLFPEPGEAAFLTLDERQAELAGKLGFRLA